MFGDWEHFGDLQEKKVIASYVINPKPKKVAIKPRGCDSCFVDGYISDGLSDMEQATQKDADVEDVGASTPEPKTKALAKATAKATAKAKAKAGAKATAKAKALAKATANAKAKAKTKAKAKAKVTAKKKQKKVALQISGMFFWVGLQGFPPQTCWKVRVMIVGYCWGFDVPCLSSSCKFVCAVFHFWNQGNV